LDDQPPGEKLGGLANQALNGELLLKYTSGNSGCPFIAFGLASIAPTQHFHSRSNTRLFTPCTVSLPSYDGHRGDALWKFEFSLYSLMEEKAIFVAVHMETLNMSHRSAIDGCCK
jgi:hypothetical protein